MVEAVIFDFDLTLVDSFEAVKNSLKDLEEKHGIKSEGLSKKELWTYTVEELAKTLSEKNNNKMDWKAIMMADIHYMQKNFLDLKVRAQEMIKRFFSKGIKMGIISNNSSLVIQDVLRQEKNSELKFDVVLGFEDKTDKDDGSKDEILRRSVEKLGVSDVIYVGDTPEDIESAKGAGVKAAAVAFGLFSKEELMEVKPDYLLDKLEDLEQYVISS